MRLTKDPSGYVVIDGIMYPAATKWQLWIQRQQGLCSLGMHYFLPAGVRHGFGIQLCVCGRCGLSTWWTRPNTWTLQTHLGYWKQAGRTIPAWSLEGSLAGTE
jgi:hypothetical protein